MQFLEGADDINESINITFGLANVNVKYILKKKILLYFEILPFIKRCIIFTVPKDSL